MMYIKQFMFELLEPAFYVRRSIDVNYSDFSAEWNITGKSIVGRSDINANMTYGTERANAYKILEDTLNLRDVRIYDTITDADGKEKRVLNSKETTLAQQKQQEIMEEQQVMMNQLADAIKTFMESYNEEKGYAMILSNTAGVPVIVGDPALDITDDVIACLNAEYIELKKSEN